MSIKSSSTLSTTGKIREALADCLVRVSAGTLAANDAKAIIGLSNQITTNMAVELKHQTLQSALGHKTVTFGKVNIGE